MVEDRRIEKELSRTKRVEAADIRNHWFDGGHLPHYPLDGGSVVQTGAGRGRANFWDCHKKSGLAKNEGGEMEVGVGDISPP